jgi:DNA-binding NarL/FixJ family response regulator
MCGGASNAEIGQALRLAERTVKSHVSAILLKLGARDRTAAVVTAFEAGVQRH